MKPLVFLDFDDVLAVHRKHDSRRVESVFKEGTLDHVPELWQWLFHYSARTNLQVLHDEFNPEYVISSSWTLFLDRPQIVEVLRRTGLEFVANNLHREWRTPRKQESYRLTEIEAWLDQNNLGAARPFVILDDELSGQSIPGSHLEERAVLCEAWVGFTHPKLKLAQKILRAQLPSGAVAKDRA
jgi:hypothetical protein